MFRFSSPLPPTYSFLEILIIITTITSSSYNFRVIAVRVKMAVIIYSKYFFPGLDRPHGSLTSGLLVNCNAINGQRNPLFETAGGVVYDL